MTRRKNPQQDETLDPEVTTALLEAVAPLAPPAELRARVLQRLRAPASGAITLRAGEGRWKQLAPGIEVKRLFLDDHAATKSFLLRAAPGTTLPSHHHTGWEECLVLEGEFTMGDLTLHAGDFHCVPRGVMHPEASTRTGVLVYLRGASIDYPEV